MGFALARVGSTPTVARHGTTKLRFPRIRSSPNRLFIVAFPATDGGRGRFVPAEYIEAAELPDDDYPFVFVTGRQLEHWHTGTMTRHSRVLDAIEPGPCVMINPDDLNKFGIKTGDTLVIESRRGRIAATTRADEHMQKGVVMMPFTFSEAAANLISNDALDPYGKIPEFKFCAVQLIPGKRNNDKLIKHKTTVGMQV